MTPATILSPTQASYQSRLCWATARRIALHDLARHKVRSALTVLIILIPIIISTLIAVLSAVTIADEHRITGARSMNISSSSGIFSADTTDGEPPASQTIAEQAAYLADYTDSQWIPLADDLYATHGLPQNSTVQVRSYNESYGPLNVVTLTEGRLPRNEHEILLTSRANIPGVGMGDSVTLTQRRQTTTYQVVGRGLAGMGSDTPQAITWLSPHAPSKGDVTWYLAPHEQCSQNLSNMVRALQNVTVTVTHCPSTPLAASNSGTATGDQVMSYLAYLALPLVGVFVLVLLLLPSMSLITHGLANYLRRLQENGASPMQRRVVVTTAAVLPAVVALLVGMPLAGGLVYLCHTVGFFGLQHAPLAWPTMPLVSLAGTALAGCGAAGLVADWVSQRPQLTQHKSAPRSRLVVPLATFAGLCVVMTWLVMASTATAWLWVVSPLWVIAGVVAAVAVTKALVLRVFRPGWWNCRVGGLFPTWAQRTLASVATAVGVLTTVAALFVGGFTSVSTMTITSPHMPQPEVAGQIHAGQQPGATGEETVDLDLMYSEIAHMYPQANIVRMMAPKDMTSWVPLSEPTPAAVVGVGHCQPEDFAQDTTLDMLGGTSCMKFGESPVHYPLVALSVADAASILDLTEDQQQAFSAGAVVVDAALADHHDTASVAIGQRIPVAQPDGDDTTPVERFEVEQTTRMPIIASDHGRASRSAFIATEQLTDHDVALTTYGLVIVDTAGSTVTPADVQTLSVAFPEAKFSAETDNNGSFSLLIPALIAGALTVVVVIPLLMVRRHVRSAIDTALWLGADPRALRMMPAVTAAAVALAGTLVAVLFIVVAGLVVSAGSWQDASAQQAWADAWQALNNPWAPAAIDMAIAAVIVLIGPGVAAALIAYATFPAAKLPQTEALRR